MKNFFTAFLILIIISIPVSYAQSSSYSKKIEKLLLMVHTDKTLDQVFNKMRAIQTQQLQNINLSKAQAGIMKDYYTKLYNLLGTELKWDKIKPFFIKLYAENFTEKDIDQLTKFYESPVGKKYIRKMPVLLDKGMQLGQERVQMLIPQIQALTKDMMRKLKNTK